MRHSNQLTGEIDIKLFDSLDSKVLRRKINKFHCRPNFQIVDLW